MVTFRLAGSVPHELMDRWKQELQRLTREQAQAERRRRVERYLDTGAGPVWLSDPKLTELVQNALLHFDGRRYVLLAWAIMANHVHAVFSPIAPHDVSGILQSWKSFTGTMANRRLGRMGAFWDRDYFDRFIRNDRHLAAAIGYIEMNPVKAGLCGSPEEWPWSSATRR
ncbi:MAG: transposase [Armatimonadota bacterium]